LSNRAAVIAGAGFIAGLGYAAALLSFQRFMGASTPLSYLQDKIVALAPGAVTSGLIDRLQFAAKPLALTGMVLGQAFLVAIAAALIDCSLANRWRALWTRGMVRAATFGLAIWILNGIVFLEFQRAGPGKPGEALDMAQALAMALSAACSGLIFAAVSAAAEGWRAPHDAESLYSGVTPDESRRRLVAAIVAVGTVGWSGGLLAKAIEAIGEQGSPVSRGAAGTEVGASGIPEESAFKAPSGVSSYITPTEHFYVISKNLIDPNVSANGWSLEIKGHVDRAIRFSYSDLTAMPPAEVFATLECVSNSVGGDLMSNTRWTGVPLASLLDHAGVRDEAKWVNFTASDGYVEGLPVDVARQRSTLLAYHMDGKPLTAKHGYPIRVLAPGNYGMKNPKWLTSIELSSQSPDGFWEKQGWNVESGIKTTARFDTRPRQAISGTAIALGGVAFAGDRGVGKVEVSVDGGQSWQPALLSHPASKATWLLWSTAWTPQRAGRAIVAVRAIDGAGHIQVADRHEPYPSGATGYDAIQVQVSDPPQG
jgi:DMSO/TMAO reductase YedYZ molybdopterin-dependent catalytic subunit